MKFLGFLLSAGVVILMVMGVFCIIGFGIRYIKNLKDDSPKINITFDTDKDEEKKE